MVALAPRYAQLLDLAVAVAKRAGHGQLSTVHLAAVLIDRDEDRYSQILGSERARTIREVTRPTGRFVKDLDTSALEQFLGEAADGDLDDLLRANLEAELAAFVHDPGRSGYPSELGSDPLPSSSRDERPTLETPRTGGLSPLPGEQPRRLPAGLDDVVVPVKAEWPSGMLGRDELVDKVVLALARKRPRTPLLVGRAGAGRSSVAQALADRLAAPGYDGPLSGAFVVRLDAVAVVGKDRMRTLRHALQALDGLDDAVIVVDDLELLAGLGWGNNVDLPSLNVLRAAIGRPRSRLVMMLDDRFRARLEAQDRELYEELLLMPVPPLSPDDLLRVGQAEAARLSAHHGVSIADNVVAAAGAPAAPTATRDHPALLVSRLDGASVRAAMQGRIEVTETDLDLVTCSQGNGDTEVEALLRRRIVGQDVAIERVTGRLALTRAEMDLRPERPDGVFLFVGPTGVGKTAFALALGEALGGRTGDVIRLDMSEYLHETAVNRLIGPPPGYVGSTEPDQWLTTRVRDQPDAVILVDEIEKAHLQVWNTFLQVFDAGRLTDGRGREADFSRTVIVLTSNLGAAEAAKPQVGFGAGEDQRAIATERLLAAVRSALPPELLNRLDDVIVFDPLPVAAIHEIAVRELEAAVDRLGRRGVRLIIEGGVVGHLSESGYDPAYGARHLHRNIERQLLQPAARLPTGEYRVSVSPDGLSFHHEAEVPA
jgi:ATP-dependent Clp protease ATP-binding subunit ClpA